MTRRLWVFAVAGLAVFGTASGPIPAAAQPTTEDHSCSYRLSGPEFAERNGIKTVTATMVPNSCPGRASPVSLRVCVSPPGGSGTCARNFSWLPTTTSVPAIHRGTYTATGDGCYGFMETVTCVPLGPVSAEF